MESEKLLRHLHTAPERSDISFLLDRLEQKSEQQQTADSVPFHVEVGPYTVFSCGRAGDDASLSPRRPSETSSLDQSPPASEAAEAGGLLLGCPRGRDEPPPAPAAALAASHVWIQQTRPDAAASVSLDAGGRLGAHTRGPSPPSHGMPPSQPLSPAQSVPSPTLYASRLASGSPYLPPNVRFLLHHYENQVIDSLSAMPLPHDKAPWRSLHLPSAVRAYGELDIFGASSLARVSLLYSLLSLTCYHLCALYAAAAGGVAVGCQQTMATDSVDDWKTQAEKFRGIARTAFRKHLAAKSSSSSSASAPASAPASDEDYTESLLAAMSLVCVGIIGGDPWDARLYIRQCEVLIRAAVRAKHGFPDRVRQLHHIFAFVRLMEQSTFCHAPSEYVRLLESRGILPSEVRLVQEAEAAASRPTGHSDDDGGNKDSASSPSAQAAVDVADARWLPLGPADDCGFNVLYSDSGQLFHILRRTNALLRKMEDHRHHHHHHHHHHHCRHPHPNRGNSSRFAQPVALPEEDLDLDLDLDLVAEANSLEQVICDLASDFDTAPDVSVDGADGAADTDARGDDAMAAMAQCMRNAFYNALLVYFFREVRRAHPQILQHYVHKVLASLECHQAIKSQAYPHRRIGTIVWPGFIAACEALGAGWRRRAIGCLRYPAAAGFRNGESAESVIHEVWNRRDRDHVPVSWREVARQLRVYMLLS